MARQADQRDARIGYAVFTAAGLELLTQANTTAQALGLELLGNARAE